MEYVLMAGALVLLTVLIMGKEYLNSRICQKKQLEKLYEGYGRFSERKYGAAELSHIQSYYQKHKEAVSVDDITWNDFSMDSIYQKINTSCSAAGDEYLYYRLRTPMYSEEELSRSERQIRYFMEHEKERHALQEILWSMGRSGRHSIYEYLDQLDTLGSRRNAGYLFFDLLLAVCIGIMFLSLPVGIILFLAVCCHNIIGYYKQYKEVEPYITSFYYVRRMLDSAARIAKLPMEDFAQETKTLAECCRAMKRFERNSNMIIYVEKGSGNPLGVLLDYARMLLYLDLIQFYRSLSELRAHLTEVDTLMTTIGQLETAIVIGSYRTAMKDNWCVPMLYTGKEPTEGTALCIEEVIHPLLENPVPNSITARRGVLLTGSNASGKSTFLRTVGICALMAQTLHTCPAKSYRAPLFFIYSSMSLKDDVKSGDSYYMAEVKSIKRILDQVQRCAENRKVLCFVDEVLRGTNTIERISASTQILRTLSGEQVICFAATHDGELTQLLKESYDNYHFEETLEQDDIFFPYQLMPGPATTRNAIALLQILGYDRSLVAQAEEMARHFEETGGFEA